MTEIRTTHVGSLPRSAAVTEVLFAAERAEPVDEEAFEAVIAPAVENAVARQVGAGVDIVSNGEMAKIATRRTSRTGSPVSTVTPHAGLPPTSRSSPASLSARRKVGAHPPTGAHDALARSNL